MTAAPLVSVVMPTHNRRTLLPASVESVRRQTLDDWELVLVDDASTDDTGELVAGRWGSDARIRYVRNTRSRGPSGARNCGVSLARGKYIAYLDSDDEWEPFHLQATVAHLETAPAVVEIMTANPLRRRRDTGEVFRFDELVEDEVPHEKRGELWLLDPDRLLDAALRTRVMTTQTVVGRAEVLRRIAWDETVRAGTDCLYMLELAALKPRVGHLQRYHVTYWAHGGNLTDCTGTHTAERRAAVGEAFADYYRAALKRLPLSDAQRRALRRKLANHLFWLVGYSGYLSQGDVANARRCFVQAIGLWPSNLGYWKTAVWRGIVGGGDLKRLQSKHVPNGADQGAVG
jgi:glycosyltransferase involved in cell wall biosynthesis